MLCNVVARRQPFFPGGVSQTPPSTRGINDRQHFTLHQRQLVGGGCGGIVRRQRVLHIFTRKRGDRYFSQQMRDACDQVGVGTAGSTAASRNQAGMFLLALLQIGIKRRIWFGPDVRFYIYLQLRLYFRDNTIYAVGTRA